MTDGVKADANSSVLQQENQIELLLRTGSCPLGFTFDEDHVFLIARDRTARWPTEVLREGVGHLRVGGRSIDGRVDMVTDPEEKTRITDLFRIRYGPDAYQRWYAHPARVLRVERSGDAPRHAGSPEYRRWLTSEFDNVAEDYDRHITGNRVNRLLRDRSLALLRATFADRHRLLEIGCGSGMETLPLLADGREIVCVDISSKMLDVVRRKARSAGRSGSLETVVGSAGDLGRLPQVTASAPFDGAYSTYGALNCEEHLGAFASALSTVLRPGAPFVAGVYNRWCAFELAGYGLTGRWRRALGRASSPVLVGASRFCVDVFSYSATDFRRRFRPWFHLRSTEGVPVLLPPSDLDTYAERFSRHWNRLAKLDQVVGRRWPFRSLGDHFLMTFDRSDGSGGPAM